MTSLGMVCTCKDEDRDELLRRAAPHLTVVTQVVSLEGMLLELQDLESRGIIARVTDMYVDQWCLVVVTTYDSEGTEVGTVSAQCDEIIYGLLAIWLHLLGVPERPASNVAL
jgi:hypothetical protein